MEKQKMLPALRFSSFSDDWKLNKVSTLLSRISERVEVESEEQYTQIGIRSHGKGIFHKEPVRGIELGNKRVFWVKPNKLVLNIVFAWERAIAKTSVNENGMIASHRFPMYQPENNSTNLDFLLHFFLTPKGKQLLENASPGGAGRNKTLGQKEFENSKILTPSIEEQTIIAVFLSTVDEKLNQLKEKKNLLLQYRKGVVKKILTQRIRFVDETGVKFPEWKKKKLREVASKASSNISANKIEDNVGDYIIYGASGILKKIDFYREENEYISIIKDGAGVGRVFYCEGKSSVLGTMDIIKPNSDINTYFLFCLLNNIDFRKYVTGSTIPHIYFKDYSHEICIIPCIAEQIKIANFLLLVDNKINSCSTQIEEYEQWKKGVVQKMFC